jgi:hypothetical protein
MVEGRHIAFQNDEWDWLLHRRGHSLGVFLRPHNEHLSAIPIFVYKLFFQLFGATSTFPFRLLDAALVATSAGLVFAFVSRRIGSWVALAPAAILLFFGPGWNDLLWGFQIGYTASLAAGLGVFFALDRRDKAGDLLACVLLMVSLACSSVGLTVLVGALVELSLRSRREGRQRLWIVGLPVLLYALWYVGYGVSSVKLSRVTSIPLYDFQGLAAVAGSLTGLASPQAAAYDVSLDPGTTIAVVLLIGFVVRFIRGAPLSARFWAATATALAFWTAACLSYVSGRDANSGHYTFPVAPFVILATVEASSSIRLGRRGSILVGAASVAAVVSNLGFLNQGAKLFDLTSQYERAELGALQVARGLTAPSFRPEDPSIVAIIGVHNMVPIDAGPYFSAIDAFGSAADSVSTILMQPEDVKEAADLVLAKAEGLALRPTGLSAQTCLQRDPAGGGIDVTSGPGTIVLEPLRGEISDVAMRRFADAYQYVTLGSVSSRKSVSLRLPPDRSSLPWQIRIVTTSQVRICGAALTGGAAIVSPSRLR